MTVAEEYSITSVTECNNLLYLRHYNIQETIEQPTTFQEEYGLNTMNSQLNLRRKKSNS